MSLRRRLKNLTYPSDLLTVDEAALAGFGFSASTIPCHAKPFLHSGFEFWLLSPDNRDSSGDVFRFAVSQNGVLGENYYFIYSDVLGLRPVISLKHFVSPASDSGTAVDLWVVSFDNYTVSFDSNGGSGTMDGQTIFRGVPTTLNSNTFTAPSGKVFVGWNTAADGGGTSYTDGQSVTDLASAGCTITLYAQWRNIVYMQNMSISDCPAAPTTAYDNRDGTSYLVQKLADNKCWMLENLAFDAAANKASITTSNTHTSSAGVTKLQSTSSTWQDSRTTPYISTAYINTLVTSYGTAATNSQAKVGVYYNYCAASGGTICTSPSNSSASYDICPYGWKLPSTSSSNNGSYYYLYNTAYGANATNFKNALSTPLSGDYYIGSGSLPGWQNTYGYFWSSSSSGTYDSMNTLEVTSNSVSPNTPDDSDYGYSIRCVLNN